MIAVKYLQVCVAFLKQVWSSIRQSLPVVTWPSRAGSNVLVVQPETAPDKAPPPQLPEPPVTGDALAQVLKHLEYLGYEVRLDPTGWSHAEHPYRYDFFLRVFAQGIRLHCSVGIGAAIGNTRAAWLEFLNTANEQAHIAQFSLFEDDRGGTGVRICAFVSGVYSRPAFAMALDMWRDDLEFVRKKPAFLQETGTVRADKAAAVTVN